MEQKNDIMEQKNDEIDLIHLFNTIGKGIKKAFLGLFNILSKLFMAVLNFALRNYIALIVIFVIAFSLQKVKIGSQYFESSMKIRGNAINNQTAIDYVNRLEDLVINNPLYLAKQLKIDSTNASMILDINAYWAIDNDGDGVADLYDKEHAYLKNADDSISLRVTDYFLIDVSYNGRLNLSELNDAIENYFNQNALFIKQNELRKKQDEEMLALTTVEQEKLDTLRNKYNKAIVETIELPATKNGQLVFLNEKESELKSIRLFHNDIFVLKQKSQKLYKKTLLSPNVITILERLDLSKKPVSKVTKQYGLLFLLFGIVVLIIVENRKKIIELKKQAKK